MCGFGGIFGNFALQLGPKSLALSKKSFWKMPVAKSDMKQEMPWMEPSAEPSRAGRGCSQPVLSHPKPAGSGGLR